MNKFLASLATSLLFSIKNKNQSAAASFIITRSYGQRSAATQRLRLFELYDQNAGRSQRLQQFSTGSRVWFQLVIGFDDTSNRTVAAIDIDVTSKDFSIYDFSKAVKNEFPNLLNHVVAMQLNVYPPGTAVPVPVGMDSASQRKLEVRKLPLISSVKVAEVLLRFPKLNAWQALFYGLIPALIYEAREREAISSKAEEAIKTWIDAGIDTEEVWRC
jgi:hypothetical protein